jgi:hypothetical protein
MTPYLISVDPGKHFCGVAWFTDGVLTFCEYRATETPIESALVPVRAVCELMRIRPGARFAADLIDVAVASGRMCANFPNVEYIAPETWGGQVPKPIKNKRVLTKLSPDEIKVLETCDVPKHLQHNVLDAIAIGCYILNR